MTKPPDCLVGDIGGTHARFALLCDDVEPSGFTDLVTLDCRDFGSIEAALSVYIDQRVGGLWPKAAVIAVAGPVSDGEVEFTNLRWKVSEHDLTRSGRFERVVLLNDFAAAALAAPHLGPGDLEALGPERAGLSDATLTIMGPGTGFGVAALVREAGREAVMAGEGGHMAFAPTTPREIEILKALSPRYGRVSLERLLSGPGLLDLHQALSALEGREAGLDLPEKVAAAAAAGDPLARETLKTFCDILGSAAGDLALAYGARGGVFITGGVALSLRGTLKAGDFRRRFEDKGRFRRYMSAIPTALVVHPCPNLIGAAQALRRAVATG